MHQAEARGRIAAGDALSGTIGAALAARAAREALRRPEAEGARFSLGHIGLLPGVRGVCRLDAWGVAGARFSLGAGGGGGWDDEFLKLVGPEIARFVIPAPDVPAAWARQKAESARPGGATAR